MTAAAVVIVSILSRVPPDLISILVYVYFLVRAAFGFFWCNRLSISGSFALVSRLLLPSQPPRSVDFGTRSLLVPSVFAFAFRDTRVGSILDFSYYR